MAAAKVCKKFLPSNKVGHSSIVKKKKQTQKTDTISFDFPSRKRKEENVIDRLIFNPTTIPISEE
jgi:hypothetical protein